MDPRRLLTVRWLVMGALLAGCATGSGLADGTEEDAGWDKKNDFGEPEDAGSTEDAGKAPDVGEPEDAGQPEDAGEPVDAAGPEDAGARDVPPVDVGVDSGARDVPPADVGFDSGVRDVPPADVGFDSGPPDTGPRDSGPPDTGPRDAGPADTGPRDAGTPDSGRPCTPTVERFNGVDDDCDGLVDEGFEAGGISLACNHANRVIPDRDIDDYGSTSGSDSLEVYCVREILRFCLSGEACPWRAGVPAVEDGRSCSSAGLSGPQYPMAYYIPDYLIVNGWRFDEVYCPPTGRVRFAVR